VSFSPYGFIDNQALMCCYCDVSFSNREQCLQPLTIEDKRKLIADISSLSVDKMTKVVEIVQVFLDTKGTEDSGEVEIPLDRLDTRTLRDLMKFVVVSVCWLYWLLSNVMKYTVRTG
jgi:hypothetical protein